MHRTDRPDRIMARKSARYHPRPVNRAIGKPLTSCIHTQSQYLFASCRSPLYHFLVARVDRGMDHRGRGHNRVAAPYDVRHVYSWY